MVSGIGACANTLSGCMAMVNVLPLYQVSRPRPPVALVWNRSGRRIVYTPVSDTVSFVRRHARRRALRSSSRSLRCRGQPRAHLLHQFPAAGQPLGVGRRLPRPQAAQTMRPMAASPVRADRESIALHIRKVMSSTPTAELAPQVQNGSAALHHQPSFCIITATQKRDLYWTQPTLRVPVWKLWNH